MSHMIMMSGCQAIQNSRFSLKFRLCRNGKTFIALLFHVPYSNQHNIILLYLFWHKNQNCPWPLCFFMISTTNPFFFVITLSLWHQLKHSSMITSCFCTFSTWIENYKLLYHEKQKTKGCRKITCCRTQLSLYLMTISSLPRGIVSNFAITPFFQIWQYKKIFQLKNSTLRHQHFSLHLYPLLNYQISYFILYEVIMRKSLLYLLTTLTSILFCCKQLSVLTENSF